MKYIIDVPNTQEITYYAEHKMVGLKVNDGIIASEIYIDAEPYTEPDHKPIEALNCSEIPNSSDTISRQAAIDVCNSAIDLWHGQLGEGALVAVKEGIESLPSADPEYKELQDWKTDFKGFIDALDMPRDDYCGIMEYIDEVPSAEPRKKGKWIHDNPNTFRCSECNKYLDISCGNMKMNFCPNCGADMRGDNNRAD